MQAQTLFVYVPKTAPVIWNNHAPKVLCATKLQADASIQIPEQRVINPMAHPYLTVARFTVVMDKSKQVSVSDQ